MFATKNVMFATVKMLLAFLINVFGKNHEVVWKLTILYARNDYFGEIAVTACSDKFFIYFTYFLYGIFI